MSPLPFCAIADVAVTEGSMDELLRRREGRFLFHRKTKRSVMLEGERNRRPFTRDCDCKGSENPERPLKAGRPADKTGRVKTLP